MGTKKQKTRADIDPKYKWALERLYADHEAWEQDFAKIPALTDAVAAYEGKVTESAASLLGILKANGEARHEQHGRALPLDPLVQGLQDARIEVRLLVCPHDG